MELREQLTLQFLSALFRYQSKSYWLNKTILTEQQFFKFIINFRSRTERSSIDGVNLNRVFPGKADGLPTEKLAAWIFDNLIKNLSFTKIFESFNWLFRTFLNFL